MIAKIRIAKNRRRPICSRGIIAFMIDFRTTCKPVETERGRPVRKRSARASRGAQGRVGSTPKGLSGYKTLQVLII